MNMIANGVSSYAIGARRCVWLSVALAAALPPSVLAQEIGIFSTLGTYRTDNVNREGVQIGSKMSNVSTATVGTFGNKETKRLKTDWSAALISSHFTDDSLEAHNYADLTWTLDADIVPRRFTWRIRDDLGEVLVDSTLPDTPLNRAGYNTFITGPILNIPVSEKMGLSASAQTNESHSDEDSLGGSSDSVELALVRLLSARSSAAFRVAHTDGQFNSETIGNYDTDKAFFRFDTTGGLTTLTADVGLNRASVPVVTDNLPFYQFEIVRTLPTGSTLELTLARQLTNVAEQFGRLAGDPDDPRIPGDSDDATRALDLGAVEALYQARSATLGYVLKRDLLDIRASISRRTEESLRGRANGQITYDVLEGSWYRIISSKTGIRLWTVFTDRAFEGNTDRSDRDTEVGLELAKPIYSPAFRWVLTLSRYARDSTDPTAEYTEYRLGALLRYSKFIFQPRRAEIP
jgi:hypothetical protein